VRTWDSRRTLPIKEGDFEIIQGLYGARIYIEDGTSITSKKGRGKSPERGLNSQADIRFYHRYLQAGSA